MAHKKAAGTAKNLRDSAGRRLGIKLFAGETVKPGNIICRQRGTKWRSGEGTDLGNDYTIHATKDGVVKFTEIKRERYDGRKYTYTVIHVVDKTETPKKATVAKKVAAPKVVKATEEKVVKKASPKATEAKKAAPKKAATPKKTTKKD